MDNEQIMTELTTITLKVHKVKQAMKQGDPTKHFHSVVVCWIDPFGMMSHREGWFDEYAEAEEFFKHRWEAVEKNRFRAWGFINDYLECKRG